MADPAYLMIWVQILLLSGCSHVMAGYYLVIDEQFDSLDMERWDFEVTANGGGNGAFEMYTPEPNNTFVKDGKLFIKPTLTADMFGEAWLTNGTLDMRDLFGRCTQAWDYGCLREGKYGTLNPVMSGCIRSRAFIQYGKVEVMAKLPRGDWMWPTIWMLPMLEEYGDWPASGDVDIAEARGNRDLGSIGINSVMSSLHWGPNERQDQVNMTRVYYTSPSGTWADGMHNYTLEWFSTGISVYVDDYLVLNAPTPPHGYWTKGGFRGRSIWSSGHQDAPFDKPFYLILNVAVGGVNGFFPDDVQNGGYKKPWKNTNDNASPDARKDFWAAKHLWYPTWQGDDAAMQVDSVRMWQFTNVDSMGETTTTTATTSTTITTTPTTTTTTTTTPTPTPTPTTTEDQEETILKTTTGMTGSVTESVIPVVKFQK